MFMSRLLRRVLLSATKSESSSALFSTSASATKVRNPLEEFFEAERNTEDEKPVTYGRGWKASELRLKSWDDLHKLWYVLLKEKNMLMSQRQMLHAQNLRFPNPERIPKEYRLIREATFREKLPPQYLLTRSAMTCLFPQSVLHSSCEEVDVPNQACVN